MAQKKFSTQQSMKSNTLRTMQTTKVRPLKMVWIKKEADV